MARLYQRNKIAEDRDNQDMKHNNLGVMYMGWTDLIEVLPTRPPKGYSNIKQISKKMGMNYKTIKPKLDRLCDEGKIKSVKIQENGRVVKYYQD